MQNLLTTIKNKFKKPDGSFNRAALFAIAGNAFFALAAMYIICLVSHPAFERPETLFMILRQMSCIGIISIGMTFVIACGGIDLSIGSLFAFSGVLSVISLKFLQTHPGTLPDWFSSTPCGAMLTITAVSVAAGISGGILNGLLITLCRIPPFIATLGTLSIFRSLSLHFADSGTLSFNDLPHHVSFMSIADANFGIIPVAGIVFILFAFIAATALNNTAFGHHLCATGSNRRAAQYAGIRVSLITFTSYVITGFCSGAAMVLFLAQFDGVSSSSAGVLYELDTIAAVVIGGTSMNGGKASVWGTFAGILILGLIFTLLNLMETAATLKDLVKGIIILFSVFIQRKEKI